MEDLLVTLATDVPKARAILTRTLRPFKLTPDGASYRISGALNLSAVVGPGVSGKSSSGGVLLDYSETAWIPMEFTTSARSPSEEPASRRMATHRAEDDMRHRAR